MFILAECIAELSHPGNPTGDAALALVAAVPLLDIDEYVKGIAQILVREKVMPAPTTGDATHVAVACVHRMDYILSWNVRHLANPNKLLHLRTICHKLGLIPPQIVTPDLLWEPDR